ncbi:hypothetical protein VPHK460_0235 [Vibrio phage K460]
MIRFYLENSMVSIITIIGVIGLIITAIMLDNS